MNVPRDLIDRLFPLVDIEVVKRLGVFAQRGDINACRSTKRMPNDIRYHKTSGLKQQYERHPLVVGQHFGAIYRVIGLISANWICSMSPTLKKQDCITDKIRITKHYRDSITISCLHKSYEIQ